MACMEKSSDKQETTSLTVSVQTRNVFTINYFCTNLKAAKLSSKEE